MLHSEGSGMWAQCPAWSCLPHPAGPPQTSAITPVFPKSTSLDAKENQDRASLLPRRVSGTEDRGSWGTRAPQPTHGGGPRAVELPSPPTPTVGVQWDEVDSVEHFHTEFLLRRAVQRFDRHGPVLLRAGVQLSGGVQE